MTTVDLESRLVRLETAIEAKLNIDKLEQELQVLAQDPTIRETLHWIDRQPNLYDSGQDSTSLRKRIDVILGQEEIYRTLAAQLKSISQISTPTISTSQQLIDVLPEARELYDIAVAQAAEIEVLTARTIKLLDEWYRFHVRPMNQAAIETDRALMQAQRQHRAEKRQAAD